jgi:hypothetical protein
MVRRRVVGDASRKQSASKPLKVATEALIHIRPSCNRAKGGSLAVSDTWNLYFAQGAFFPII